MTVKRQKHLWGMGQSSANRKGEFMNWTRIFRYKVGYFDLWEYISFTFCYAGFLWFASDEDLAWFKYYSEKENSIQRGLEWAYKRVIENQNNPRDYEKEEKDVYNKGYDAPLRAYPNLNYNKEKYIREYWEETRRWEHYGLTPKEMEEKRRKPSYKEGKPERRQRMNEPIVYEKALNITPAIINPCLSVYTAVS